jgi:acyl-CoA thioester hydrolase
MSTQEGAVVIDIRWRDLDHLGHIFHGEYLTILDEARTQWLEDIVGLPHADAHVIVRMELDFKASLDRYDKAIRVDFRVERIGTSSITIEEHMKSHVHDTEAVVSTTTIVLWDASNIQPRPLTSQDRELLTAHTRSKP